jgi:two-component system NtrC family sensor kinase
MDNGGTLTVSSHFLPENGTVEAQFSDTGVGIPKEHLIKVYDPFFTTKEKGTGLGLSVVYGIVDRHGGRIYIKKRAENGTSVIVQFPVAEKTE